MNNPTTLLGAANAHFSGATSTGGIRQELGKCVLIQTEMLDRFERWLDEALGYPTAVKDETNLAIHSLYDILQKHQNNNERMQTCLAKLELI